jgi:hypothetical protein
MLETAKRKWLALKVSTGARYGRSSYSLKSDSAVELLGMETRILVDRTSELP